MFISEITNADAMPVLRAQLRFAGRRHGLIAHNIANISTPDFRPMDVSVADFRESLGKAIDERRGRAGAARGGLDLNSRQVEQSPSGRLELKPREAGRNILFHDRNNRSLEGLMQDLVENAGAYRVASDLMRNQTDLLRAAISERV